MNYPKNIKTNPLEINVPPYIYDPCISKMINVIGQYGGYDVYLVEIDSERYVLKVHNDLDKYLNEIEGIKIIKRNLGNDSEEAKMIVNYWTCGNFGFILSRIGQMTLDDLLNEPDIQLAVKQRYIIEWLNRHNYLLQHGIFHGDGLEINFIIQNNGLGTFIDFGSGIYDLLNNQMNSLGIDYELLYEDLKRQIEVARDLINKYNLGYAGENILNKFITLLKQYLGNHWIKTLLKNIDMEMEMEMEI